MKLGEFELLVLLAILRNETTPYANTIRQDLVKNAHRKVTRGALYRTLDRLKEKGLVEWEMTPSQVPDRGGHPMRKLLVTSEGLAAAHQSNAVLQRFLSTLDSKAGA